MDFQFLIYPGHAMTYILVLVNVFIMMQAFAKSSVCATLDTVYIFSVALHAILPPLNHTQPLVGQVLYQGCIILFYRFLLYQHHKKSLSADLLAVKFAAELIGVVLQWWFVSPKALPEMDFPLTIYPVSVLVYVVMSLHVFTIMQAFAKSETCASLDTVYILSIILHVILPPLNYTQPLVGQLVYQFFVIFSYRFLLNQHQKRPLSANLLAVKFLIELTGFVLTTTA